MSLSCIFLIRLCLQQLLQIFTLQNIHTHIFRNPLAFILSYPKIIWSSSSHALNTLWIQYFLHLLLFFLWENTEPTCTCYIVITLVWSVVTVHGGSQHTVWVTAGSTQLLLGLICKFVFIIMEYCFCMNFNIYVITVLQLFFSFVF